MYKSTFIMYKPTFLIQTSSFRKCCQMILLQWFSNPVMGVGRFSACNLGESKLNKSVVSGQKKLLSSFAKGNIFLLLPSPGLLCSFSSSIRPHLLLLFLSSCKSWIVLFGPSFGICESSPSKANWIWPQSTGFLRNTVLINAKHHKKGLIWIFAINYFLNQFSKVWIFAPKIM